MIMRTLKTIILFVLLSLTCAVVQAQEDVPSSANLPRPKKTTVNFEDQLIEGQAQKPDLMYLLQKKKFNYKKLIRLRENFLPELRQTGNEIAPAKKSKEK